ncbi:MAG: gamma carbonic anhydrase family protein [Minwuiales bacterium]|nr:gamma carbonic anhydrase family protein [Minwuiales bacterium]
MQEFGPAVTLNDPAFIHPTAQIYGKVTIGTGVSVWINAAIRSESQDITIGDYTNIQDFVMLHVGYGKGVHVGRHCSITHHVTLHGCTVGDNCLIGINTTIMDGCVIGDNCIVGAHTFLKEGTVIPDNSIVAGSPGAVRKTRNSFVENRMNAFFYYHNGLAYAEGNHRRWQDPDFLELAGKEMEKLRGELTALSEEAG